MYANNSTCKQMQCHIAFILWYWRSTIPSIVVWNPIKQTSIKIALSPLLNTILSNLNRFYQMLYTGCPRIREIREIRENFQLFFPAGKNQGIWFWGAKIREKSGNLILGSQNQGKIREFYFCEKKNHGKSEC